MDYLIRENESLKKGARRVARGCLADAVAQLTTTGADAHHGIHEARKRIKELRALVRLLRKPLGKTGKQENRFLRDTAALLAEFRDAGAMVEAFDSFAACSSLPQDQLAEIGRQLALRRDAMVATPERIDEAMQEAAERLRQMADRVADWQIGDRFESLLPGLQRCYRQGRKRFDRACRTDDDEALHEWRKRVKDYWYQTRLLNGICPPIMSAWQTELKQLSDLLGDDHDLTVMKALFNQEADRFGGVQALEPVLRELAGRQQQLRASARLHGGRLYVETTPAYLARLQGWWTGWREPPSLG